MSPLCIRLKAFSRCARTICHVLFDLVALVPLVAKSKSALVAEKLFLRKQLATSRSEMSGHIVQILTLASEYGRYGYRRIKVLLQQAGWNVGKDRVQCIWRREGLKVPAKQKPRRRLWLNDGSCIRLRPDKPNHVWSSDFVDARTHDGRSLRLLTMIDEFTRKCRPSELPGD